MSNSFIWPKDKTLSGATTQSQSGPRSNGKDTLHSPKLQDWNLTIKLFSVIFRTLIGQGLPFFRDAVSVFSALANWVELHRISNRRRTSMFICSLTENISVSDKSLEEIRLKQNAERVCSQVINYYKMDHRYETARRNPEIKLCWLVNQDLTVYQGLLYQRQLVIPTELQKDSLECLNEGLQDIDKCQAQACEIMW